LPRCTDYRRYRETGALAGRSDVEGLHAHRRHPQRHAEAARVPRMPEDPAGWAASAKLPQLRPRRLCDAATQQARDRAFPTPPPIGLEGYVRRKGWGWCCVDEVMFDLSNEKHRITVRSRAIIESSFQGGEGTTAGKPIPERQRIRLHYLIAGKGDRSAAARFCRNQPYVVALMAQLSANHPA